MMLITSVEILGHLSYRVVKGKYLFQHNQSSVLFEEHPFLVGVPKRNFQLSNDSGDIKITTDQFGRRLSAPKALVPKKSAKHIVCLGGSTTFGTGITDEKNWPYVLQQKLGVDYKLSNLGVPGYSSLEAIIQLSTIVPELEPDIIIIYQGWNDIKNYHQESSPKDYFDHGTRQSHNLKVDRKASITDYSFFFFLAKKIRTKMIKDPKKEHFKYTTDQSIDSVYVRNLKTIHLLSSKLGARQIFVPQVLNLEWFEQNKGQPNLWTPTIPNEEFPRLMQQFNALMTEALSSSSDPSDLITVDSIQQAHNWTKNDFVDEGHFSDQGAAKFANIMYQLIRDMEQVSKD